MFHGASLLPPDHSLRPGAAKGGFTWWQVCGIFKAPSERGGHREADNDRQQTGNRPAIGALLIYFTLAFGIGLYFTFAAVQGDYGLFRRAEIEAEARALQARLDALEARVARMENLTRRLSDDYLDLDLLDQQARDVLGLVRADEIVIR